MGLMLTCQEVAELLSEYSEGALPLTVRLKVRLHLALCHGCEVLRTTLGVMPQVCREAFAEASTTVPPAAQHALTLALRRLHQPRTPRPLAVDPVPLCLAAETDASCKMLTQTREALIQGRFASDEPYLPQEVLDQLPPPSSWDWHLHPTSRSVLLWEDPGKGLRLTLLHALPGYQQPVHTHLGSESILILDGNLEDGDGLYTRGRWIHHGDGSTHAPAALGAGCWCLIREEGTVRIQSLLRRGRNPLAA